jgi:hypothetical protein
MTNVILGCLTAVLIAGCASTPKDFSTIYPVGIVSVLLEENINWSDEEPESPGILGSFINKKIDESNDAEVSVFFSRSSVFIDNVEGTLRTSLLNCQVPLTDRDFALNAASYQGAAQSKMLKAANLIKPDGYRYIDEKNAAFARDFTAETGMRGIIYAHFRIDKAMSTGVGRNGTMRPAVTLFISIVDTTGKVFFRKGYYGTSKDTIPVVQEVYEPAAFIALIPQAIEAACAQFAADIVL